MLHKLNIEITLFETVFPNSIRGKVEWTKGTRTGNAVPIEAFSTAIDIMYGRDASVDANAIFDMYAITCSYKPDKSI